MSSSFQGDDYVDWLNEVHNSLSSAQRINSPELRKYFEENMKRYDEVKALRPNDVFRTFADGQGEAMCRVIGWVDGKIKFLEFEDMGTGNKYVRTIYEIGDQRGFKAVGRIAPMWLRILTLGFKKILRKAAA